MRNLSSASWIVNGAGENDPPLAIDRQGSSVVIDINGRDASDQTKG